MHAHCVAALCPRRPIHNRYMEGRHTDRSGEVKNYAKTMDIKAEIVDMCPTHCINYDGGNEINNAECNRCMHCITKMTKALRPSGERGATLCMGSKAPIVVGSLLSWVIVPFIKLESPYTELKDLLRKIWDWWDEMASRERESVRLLR